MKKVISLVFVLTFLFALIPTKVEAKEITSPCPTGFNTVETSFWGWSNTHMYTMCGCQTTRGYSASGSC